MVEAGPAVLLAGALVAVGTYLFRAAGLLLAARSGSGLERTEGRFAQWADHAAALLLVTVAATTALTDHGGYAGSARVLGVAVGAGLACRRTPLPLVLLAAAATTALARLAGVP